MEQIIVCGMLTVALCWWASVAPGRRTVAVRRQAGSHRIRVK